MMVVMSDYLLAIDQGTTSSRAIVFNDKGKVIGVHQLKLKQHYPKAGYVEHDPEQIWQTVKACCRVAIRKAQIKATNIKAIGISNQRETSVIWRRDTGQAISPAIVWQDRREARVYQKISSNAALKKTIRQKTGLLLDPYFSANKIAWMLENIKNARERAKQGKLAFGTIDSFLLWRLTDGKVHATDVTNASRTLLYNIKRKCWDKDLLAMFSIPEEIMPDVLDSNAQFGVTDKSIFSAAIPITGILGDQQAALFGQSCYKRGMLKVTYGTGAFMLLNTGEHIVRSRQHLLTTVAYSLNGKVTYGLEGTIFSAGSTIKWLRDNMGFIKDAKDTQRIASSVNSMDDIYLVPAFQGLGAPHWQPEARAAVFGMSLNTSSQQIVRAALESVCYRSKDLFTAMASDSKHRINTLRVDGGMAENDWMLQFLADILNIKVQRAKDLESSAKGVALVAGLGVGLYRSLTEISQLWSEGTCFSPQMKPAKRRHLYAGWRKVIEKVL